MNSKKIYIFIFLLITFYTIWNGRNWILGPEIIITSPPQGAHINANVISIEGTAKNVSFITLNGREIYTDKAGNFKEDVTLTHGENLLEIFAKDRFNKTKIERVYLYNGIQN